MNFATLKRYISSAQSFWTALRSKKLALTSSASSEEKHGDGQGMLLSKEKLVALSENDINFFKHLDAIFFAASDEYIFNPAQLLLIGQAALSRLNDPLAVEFAKINADYHKKVYSVYSSLYQKLPWAFLELICRTIFDGLRVFPVQNGLIFSSERPRLLLESDPCVSDSKRRSSEYLPRPLFSRNYSAVAFGDTFASTRGYISGSSYPELKRAAQVFQHFKDPRRAVIKFNHVLMEGLSSLHGDDPRQGLYRYLEGLTREQNRALFSLEEKKTDFSAKEKALQVFQLQHLDAFIARLDLEKPRLFSDMTLGEFSFLKVHLKEFTFAGGIIFNTLLFEQCREMQFEPNDYLNLKKKLLELSSPSSLLFQKDKLKLRAYAIERLRMPRYLYLKQRLEKSFQARLDKRFHKGIENKHQLGYEAQYHQLCQLIPSRLAFELDYLNELKNLRNHIVTRQTSAYPNVLMELTDSELQEILQIIKRREFALRTPFAVSETESISFHPTHDPHDPLNLYYTTFCNSVVVGMNARYAHLLSRPLDLIQGLFHVENSECLNMQYMIKQGFTYPDRRMQTSLLGFQYFFNQDASQSRIEFVAPELIGIYLDQNRYYTVLGLLLVNGVTLCQKRVDANRRYLALDIPSPQDFCLLRTLNQNGQFRALTILEIGGFWAQEYYVTTTKPTSSFPLWVHHKGGMSFYHSFQHLLAQLAVPFWSALGRPDDALILKLFELYLTKDPVLNARGSLEPWKEALAAWADALIYLGHEPRAREYVYRLYGQRVDEGIYMFQLLYSLIKEEQLTDSLMIKLANWYLELPASEKERTRRLDSLKKIFFGIFEQSNRQNQLYFYRSDTRCEKLVKAIFPKLAKDEYANNKINYRRWMIPNLSHDTELLFRENICDIPFEHALLSDDDSNIYDLRVIVEHVFRRTGKFVNISMKAFTAKERRRIQANPLYAQYARHIETRDEVYERVRRQEPLPSKMVREIWRLLDSTHFLVSETGHELSAGHVVNHEGIQITPQMYQENSDRCDDLIHVILFKRIDRFLFDFYKKLSPSEQTILNDHLIYERKTGTAIRFFDVIRDFSDPTSTTRRDCFNDATEILFELVLSHDKVSRFRDWLELPRKPGESLSWLDSLRQSTPQLEYLDAESAPLLRKLQVILFRLKVCSNFSFCEPIENELRTKLCTERVNGLQAFYEKLKVDVARELADIEAQMRTFFLWAPSADLVKKRDTLAIVHKSLTSRSAFDSDDMPYYFGQFIVVALARFLKINEGTMPEGLRRVYANLLKMSASKAAHTYYMLPDKKNIPVDIQELIQAHENCGVDVKQFSTITAHPSHMLEVDMNVQWNIYLQSLNEEHRNRLKNYLARQATHANSLGL